MDSNKLLNNPYAFFIKANLKNFSLGLIALVLTDFLDILPPLILARGIDQLTQNAPLSNLLHTSLWFFLCLCGIAIFRFGWRIYWGSFHNIVADDLRRYLFTKLTSLGPSFFQKNPTGELMSLVTNDVNAFQRGIGPGILVLVDAFAITVMVIPVMLYLSPDWTWKTLILLPILPFVMHKLTRAIFKHFKNQQERFSDVSGVSQEIISGVRVIKSFAQEENQTRLFNLKSRQYEVSCNKVSLLDALFDPLMHFGIATGGVILLYISAPPLVAGTITLGTFFAFHRYIQKMIWPMEAIGFGLSLIQRGNASFQRIRELLEEKTDIPDSGTNELTHFENLDIRHLTFQYPAGEQNSLHDVSFSIKAGEKIGVVGPVGSGKSTLINLLTRLYPVPKDSIFINGKEISSLSLRSLRQIVCYIVQDPFLFSDSIRENIAFGINEMPDLDDIRQTARLVSLSDEIESIPSAYEAHLGERGINLSGGQKQRMTIARGIIRNSPVIVFDDSLSAVDAKTEESIHDQLYNKQQNQTLIIISHRLASVKNADRIIVLKEGRVEAIGKHDELILTSPTYKNLHDIQSGNSMEVKNES